MRDNTEHQDGYFAYQARLLAIEHFHGDFRPFSCVPGESEGEWVVADETGEVSVSVFMGVGGPVDQNSADWNCVVDRPRRKVVNETI